MSLSRRALLTALPTLAVAGCADGPAPMPACGITSLGSVAMSDNLGPLLVEVSIEGFHAQMEIDTGAMRTTIDTEVASVLKLPDNLMKMNSLTGIGGTRGPQRDQITPEIAIANANFSVQSLAVTPLRKIPGGKLVPAGLLGVDLLSAYDLDFDFPGNRLSIYRPGGCGGAPVLWRGPSDRVALDPRSQLSVVRVSLDGVALTGIIDTGAQLTTLTSTAAARMGLTAAQLAGDRAGILQGVGAASPGYRLHRFGQLQLGTLTFDRPDIAVTETKLGPIDILIGRNLLRQTRMWWSRTANAVFFQRPGGFGLG